MISIAVHSVVEGRFQLQRFLNQARAGRRRAPGFLVLFL